MPFKKVTFNKRSDKQTKWQKQEKELRDAERTKRGHTNASQKGYYGTSFWEKQREFIKMHDGYCCRACVEDGIIRAYLNKYELTVDHIIPIPPECDWQTFVRMSEVENLQPLCKKHNIMKTNQFRVWKRKYPNLVEKRTDINL